MKLRKIISWTLKIVGCIIGFIGALAVLGAVGALEWNNITGLQFVLKELMAAALIFIARIVYVFGESLN